MFSKSKKKQKIALFLPSLRGGGAERVMVNLAQGLSNYGLKVDLVLASGDGPYLSQVPLGVRVVDLGASRVLASFFGLISYLKKEQPTVLLSAMDHANIVALWARKLSAVRCRLVVSVHNTLSKATYNDSMLQKQLMLRLIRWFYPWADAIVTVSRGVAEDLVRVTSLPLERIQVIYNPIVTSDLLEKSKEPLNHPWFMPGQLPVILSVGRLTALKDYYTLIHAFAEIRKQRPARLVILGEGEERFKLETLVHELGLENDVSLPGFVDNPYAYMARAAVFVLSSVSEGFGNVLVEAMSVGTPVVSTNCPNGPAEILENGKWGRLVPVGNPKMLADAIIAILDTKHNYIGHIKRTQMFELETITNKYLEVFHVI